MEFYFRAQVTFFDQQSDIKMNPATTPKKTEKVSKTTEAKITDGVKTDSAKTDSAKTDSAKTDSAKTEATASDNKSDKKPQSAAQTSISHFSSVSTPEYRQGWDHIFGARKETISQDEKTQRKLPENLTITHTDIDRTLYDALEQKFKALAQKEGYDFDELSRLTDLRYTITCEFKE